MTDLNAIPELGARVLVLSDLWQPFPGGAERLMFNLGRDLMRRGVAVSVLTEYARARQFDGPPVSYRVIGVFDHRDEGAAVVREVVADVKPDAIVVHHLFAFQFEAELREFAAAGIPVVQVVLNNRRLDFVAFAVWISRHVMETVGGAGPHDLVIHPPVFDDVVAERHGDAIGFIKPIPHKGVELVYAIAAAMPDRKFLVLRGEWQTLEVLSDLPNVEYMEPVDDMRDFYSRVRVVLVPSITEDAGTVGQEATANEIPCVSSRAGGLEETNAGGILIGSRDIRHWLDAINLLDDPGAYARCVAAQRRSGDRSWQELRLGRFATQVAWVAAGGSLDDLERLDERL